MKLIQLKNGKFIYLLIIYLFITLLLLMCIYLFVYLFIICLFIYLIIVGFEQATKLIFNVAYRGETFRSVLSRIGDVRSLFSLKIILLALTATASTRMRCDV